MLWRVLWGYRARYLPSLAGFLLLQLLATAGNLYLPLLNGELIDGGVATRNTGYIFNRGMVMLIISAARVLCSLGALYLGSRAATRFGHDLRRDFFQRALQLSARRRREFGASPLVTRAMNDVQQVQALALTGLTTVVVAPITCIGGVVMALRVDRPLSAWLLLGIPLVAACMIAITSRTVPRFRALEPKLEAIHRVLREQILGTRPIRALVRERHERRRFELATEDLARLAIQVGDLQAMLVPLVLLLLNATAAAVLWHGAGRVTSGALQIGSLIVYLNYLSQILVAVVMTSLVAVVLPRAAVCAERLGEVLFATSPLTPEVERPSNAEETGVIELRGVGYSLSSGSAPVLSDISFVARPGQITAIIGPTAAGKTTLLELIARLDDTTAGTVMIDDVDVRQRPRRELRSRVAMVPQHPQVFRGSVASNLRLASPHATDEELWAALELTQLGEHVRTQPLGLDSPVTQGGSNLSGGQRQRLALAQALLRHSSILLLDDAFSALDTVTERALYAALRDHLGARTLLLVTQRCATALRADQILVLDAGRLVGRGRHDELLATCPTYAEFAASQAGERGEA